MASSSAVMSNRIGVFHGDEDIGPVFRIACWPVLQCLARKCGVWNGYFTRIILEARQLLIEFVGGEPGEQLRGQFASFAAV